MERVIDTYYLIGNVQFPSQLPHIADPKGTHSHSKSRLDCLGWERSICVEGVEWREGGGGEDSRVERGERVERRWEGIEEKVKRE